MRRTQIYLTEEEHAALKLIADRKGCSQSEVIRAAVDRFIDRNQGGTRKELLRHGWGLWGDRTDLPDLQDLRKELERG